MIYRPHARGPRSPHLRRTHRRGLRRGRPAHPQALPPRLEPPARPGGVSRRPTHAPARPANAPAPRPGTDRRSSRHHLPARRTALSARRPRQRALAATRVRTSDGATQSAIHQTSGEGLPSLTDALVHDITHVQSLCPDERATLLALLRALPPGDRVCHRDFHPQNILITARGPLIIDCMTARCGNPLADYAQTRLLLRWGSMPSRMPAWKRALDGVGRRLFAREFEREYQRHAQIDPQELDAWMTVAFAARLFLRIPGEQDRFLQLVRAQLSG